jgi:hypothetical protein
MRTKSVLLTAVLALTLTTARAEWRFDADTGVVYDSNLSNSDRDADIKDDWAWKTDLRLQDALQLSRDVRVNFGADLRGELWDKYGGFNEIGPGVILGTRYRFGLGRQAPWVLLENRFGYDRFQDTDQSGYDETIDLRGGFALSDRVAVEAGYAFESFSAPNNFYDQQNHRAGVRVIVDVTSSLQVAIGYTYREGDVIAYAVPPRPEIAKFATEREDVTIFGENPLYTAYHFIGRTNSISVSAGYVLTKSFSVQVSYEFSATNRDPINYQNHIVEARVAFAY